MLKTASWVWALVLVGALHLLAAAGTWMGNDHAEIILTSHRLVQRGTFTLAPDGDKVPELSWNPPGRPRFFPGTAVALAPLVLLDRLLGWHDPPRLGRLVHLGGHAYVLGALALLGCAARRGGASPVAAAMVVLLLGMSWPTLRIARHGGAEAVVAALIALFLWGSVTGSRAARLVSCLLLPWTHPTGFLLAPTLAVFQPVQPSRRDEPGASSWLRAERTQHILASLAAVASVMFVWNYLYHGDWWGGGYGDHARTPWLSRPFLYMWFDRYLSQCVLLAPIVMTLSLATLAVGRRGQRLLLLPLAVLLVISVFFSVYSPSQGQNFVRRLSVVWLPFGLAVGLAWDSLGLSLGTARGLVFLSLAINVYWFQVIEFDHYRLDGDVFFPLVVWVTWMIEGHSLLLAATYVLSLSLVAVAAAWHLRGLFLTATTEKA